MTVKNIISLAFFILFIFSFIAKLLIQAKRNKTKAYVMGKGNKPKATRLVETFVRVSSFIWGALWAAESIFEKDITKNVGSLFDIELVNALGLVLMAAGLSIFLKALVDMKNSWRVGIDKETKTELITCGIYRFSRNPAFIGFDFMFIGLFFTYPNVLTLVVAAMNLIAFHLLILQEEKHLMGMFGSKYKDYMKKTPRYLVF